MLSPLIIPEYSCPGQLGKYQNGIVERKIKEIGRMARAMMYTAEVPDLASAYCVLQAVDILNMLPYTANPADPASSVTGFSQYLLYYNSAPPLDQIFKNGTKIINEEIGDLNDFILENILPNLEINVEDMNLVENKLPQSELRKSLFLLKNENGVLGQNNLSEAILTSTDITISSEAQNSWNKKISFTPAPGQDESSYKFLPPKPSFIVYNRKVTKSKDAKRSENMYKCWGCDSTFVDLDDLKKHLEELRNTEVQDRQVLKNRAELTYNGNKKTIEEKNQKLINRHSKTNKFSLLTYQEKVDEYHEKLEKLRCDYERELKQIDALPLMKLSHQNIRRRYIDTIHMDEVINKQILEKDYELETKFNQISLIIESLNYFHTELIDLYSSEHQDARTKRILENDLLDVFEEGPNKYDIMYNDADSEEMSEREFAHYSLPPKIQAHAHIAPFQSVGQQDKYRQIWH
jgi:hypothetical protein